jgi:hypothetical protein
MADETDNANDFATASGINALKPIVLLQVAMLRIWAHSIDRFAFNYEKALDETRRRSGQIGNGHTNSRE